MRSRYPVCLMAALVATGTYLTFTFLAYDRYPLRFTPGQNWLSDLGNAIDNPGGAAFYNVGVIITALLQAAWFAGLVQWVLERNMVQKRLLAISLASGLLCSVALVMSAVYPIHLAAVHSFWSKLHFSLSGIAFGFSAAALRYHPAVTRRVLFLGVLASLTPFLMFTLGQGKVYWMEWAAVGAFILYILAVGRQSQKLNQGHHKYWRGARPHQQEYMP